MKTTLAFACSAWLAAHLPAQCTNSLIPLGPASGVGGTILASVAWDPDGSGPLPERLVVGGDLTTAGNVAVSNIAVWDPATGGWSALGSGCNATVAALAVLADGRLVAGGTFTTAGGVPVNYIAQWDGIAWSPLGTGMSQYGFVAALSVLANGDLIAGGIFTHAGGVLASGVARWDGSTWSALGSGLPYSARHCFAVMPNGDLVTGGSGVLPLAVWDGSTWSPLGGVASSAVTVNALAVSANGDLLLGGSFSSVGGVNVNNIARWDGTTFQSLGSGMAMAAGIPAVRALQVLPNGDVVAGGKFETAGGIAATRISRWNGSAWAPLGAGMRGSSYAQFTRFWNSPLEVCTLTKLGNGALIAGGAFSVAGTAAAQHVASWNGTQWSALSTGLGAAAVNDFVFLPGGDVVAVGGFAAAGSLVTNAVARWNGSTWSNLGSAGANDGGLALAAARLPNGDLVVGGQFTSMGGVPATNIARWNGTQWSAMGTLPGYAVYDLIVAPNGTLYAAGNFYSSSTAGVFAWNGTTWNPVGGGVNGAVYALALLPDGRLVAGGEFQVANVAVWNGSVWAQLGSGFQEIARALAVLPNGDIVAAGSHGGPNGGRIWRWAGGAWSVIGQFNQDTDALHVLPNGDLLAGGSFRASVNPLSFGLARWNGTAWSALGSGIDGQVAALATSPTGEVWAGGTFVTADGAPTGGVARLATSCPASAQARGAGCAGNVLTSSLPWTGATWRAQASGLPSSALALAVTGFAPASLPLISVFPTALPGCTLFVRPDYVELTSATAGTASAQLALPNTRSLAGMVFHHQMVPIARDATLAVTATNALTLTIGAF